MSNIVVLPEPSLEFRFGQRVTSPQDGLSMFGPCAADKPEHPRSISIAVVGIPTGLANLTPFLEALAGPITDPINERLWPTYPGFEAAFGCTFPDKPTATFEIDATAL